MEWVKRQTLIHRITGIGADVVVGMAQIFDSAGAHDYAYVVADTSGQSRVSTEPADFLLLRAAGDTVYGVTLKGDGGAVFETRLLKRGVLGHGNSRR